VWRRDSIACVALSAYDDIAGLPVKVESYELENNDREYSPEFTRGSTIIHLKGAGEEGIGEDVVYDVLDFDICLRSKDYLNLADARTLPRQRLLQAMSVPGVEGGVADDLTLIFDQEGKLQSWRAEVRK